MSTKRVLTHATTTSILTDGALEAIMRRLLVGLFMVLVTHVSAQEAQAVEKGGTAGSSNSNAWKSSLPVRIVETPDQAARAKEREEKSDAHDRADLQAQELAAKAAERAAMSAEGQEVIAERQMWLSAAGVVGLLLTIYLTIRATKAAVAASKAAVAANEQTKRQFAIDQRPWISLDRPAVSIGEVNGELRVHIKIEAKNLGKAPASDAELQVSASRSLFPLRSNEKVRKFAEECTNPITWDGQGKVIFPQGKRPFSDISGEIEGTIGGDKGPYIRVLYCVIYKAEGIDGIRHTAGEVIFDSKRAEDSLTERQDFADVRSYMYSGTSSVG